MTDEVLATVNIVRSPLIFNGAPRIEGHRIAVHHIISYLTTDLGGRGSKSIQELEKDFKLRPAQIYAALSYYEDNKADTDNLLEEQERMYWED